MTWRVTCKRVHPLKNRDGSTAPLDGQMMTFDKLAEPSQRVAFRASPLFGQGVNARPTATGGAHEATDRLGDQLGVVAELGIIDDGKWDDADPPTFSHGAWGA